MVSKSQKAASRKWDLQNMRSLSCRMRREDAELFKQYCAEHNTTPGALLKKYVADILTEYKKEKKDK